MSGNQTFSKNNANELNLGKRMNEMQMKTEQKQKNSQVRTHAGDGKYLS
jgi:hypothetical protein